MPLTVRDLVSTPDLGLRLLTDGLDVDQPITWVHVSELIDPTPFLSGGELLLTTGITLGGRVADGGGAELDDYVRRLVAAAVVGLGFGTGLSHVQVSAELIEAALRQGLPLIDVPRRTPFIAIGRAVSGALAADEYAAVARTFTAQQALTRAALSPAGPELLVRLLARQLGGWVVLLDPAGRPSAAHPEIPPARLDALAAEIAGLTGHRGAVSSGFPLDADIVSLQSVGAGPRGRAFLAVGRAGRLTSADRHLVNAAVMLLTIRLEQSGAADRGPGRLRSALLRLVLSGQRELAEPIADDLAEPLPAEPFTVLVAIGDNAGWPAGLPGPPAGRSLAGALDSTLVALIGGGAGDAEDWAARLASAADLAVGLSPPTGYDGIATAHRRARQAADFGLRTGSGVIEFGEISMAGITGMIDTAAGLAFAESLLQPLTAHDESGRGDLVVSLRTWLAHHGQWDPSANALGIHRHTLRHRVDTVEQLLGRSLDSPGTRSELWLALELLDARR